MFRSLLERLATAWAELDAEGAADCFTDDAIYVEPPDAQLFRGRSELIAYFSPLEPGTYLDLHSIWFDETSQTGAAEFGFGVRGHERADHGVAVVEVRDGLIAGWREYLRSGPASFEEFVGIEGKNWRWHGGNYPADG